MIETPSLLLQGVVYLGAAVIAVPLSKRFGLGAVLGYLLAGILIGPWVLGLISDVDTVLHFAEFGVVMMLFLIGLELEPEKLWQMKAPIFGLGGLQVLLTLGITTLLAMAFHMDWRLSLVMGMGVAMSSTAIAIQTLNERGFLKQPSGQSAFSVLLFQDIAVIPLLLGLAMLAPQSHAQSVDWMVAVRALVLIAAIVVGGNYFLRPILRYIANTGMREIFVAFALFLIMGVAMLMQYVGLSMALGAFLAGVLLADSEYRQELELDIEPFKGLLLGLFFIAVGMSVDIGLILKRPMLIFGLALALVTLKIMLLFGLGHLFKQQKSDAIIFALTLSQIGEFAFVIHNTALQLQLINLPESSMLNAVVAISMMTTPILMYLHQRTCNKNYNPQGAFDTFETERKVIVAGYGRFGQVVVRLLNGVNIAPTVIEHDPNQIELIRRFGLKAYYGDIARPDVLEAAGIAKAQLFVIAIDDVDTALTIAKYVQQHYPQVKLIVRARNRTDAYDYMELGIENVRETFHSALAAAESSLVSLGFGKFQAHKMMWQFKQHDEKIMRESLSIRNDEKQRISHNVKSRQDLIALLNQESKEASVQAKDAGFGEA
ncbi:MAG: glutathione-regulated potassium-efflux system protein KefC [Methylotenera sp.]|nr:MAG: glutathione-regulated potassium-efflux system protein KefC [Methylotenera sp.]